MDLEIVLPKQLSGEVSVAIKNYVSVIDPSSQDGNDVLRVTLRTLEDAERVIEVVRQFGAIRVEKVD